MESLGRGYLVLVGTVLWPEKRIELKMAAGWRDAAGRWVRAMIAATPSGTLAAAVTATANGILAANAP